MMKKWIVSNRSFSLIEILLSLSLVLIIGSIVGAKIVPAVKRHQFSKNVERIESFFHLSKSMALHHQADVIIYLENKKEGLQCILAWDGHFSRPIENKIIKNFEFEYNSTSLSKMMLTFFSTGKISPTGELVFRDSKKKYQKKYFFEDMMWKQ